MPGIILYFPTERKKRKENPPIDYIRNGWYNIIIDNTIPGVICMPEISRFYGIVIKMFFKPKEHEPSHIHAIYGEYVGIFDICTFQMTDGDLPQKAQSLVEEWLKKNQQELLTMWNTQEIKKLPPLV